MTRPSEDRHGADGTQADVTLTTGEKSNKSDRFSKIMTAVGFMNWLRLIALGILLVSCVAVVVPLVSQGFTPALLTVPTAPVLLLSMCIKIFVMRSFRQKIVWYVIDSVFLALFTVFSGWNDESIVSSNSYSYLSYLCYLSVFTEFYLSAPSLRDSGIMFACNLVVYTVIYGVGAGINHEFATAFDITSRYFVALIVLTLHFIMFGFAMTVWRKNRQIEENMRELEESRNELLRAYDKLEEATLIEERNRISKEIHDTAGHSLTTVIMQTEAAKLLVDKDPEEAKRRISAANLQAKTCLEQMRMSVHLLSGRHENTTLKEYLEGILEETVDGTGLTIRSKIDDIELNDEAERFLANTLREGIANGIRHGNSTAFLFELKDKGSYVEFLLSDNGTGADMKTFKEGFGLSGMRAKAESLGGMIHFSSEKDEGFEILLSLPSGVKRQEGKHEDKSNDRG